MLGREFGCLLFGALCSGRLVALVFLFDVQAATIAKSAKRPLYRIRQCNKAQLCHTSH